MHRAPERELHSDIRLLSFLWNAFLRNVAVSGNREYRARYRMSALATFPGFEAVLALGEICRGVAVTC
jgi:hypothetical protein